MISAAHFEERIFNYNVTYSDFPIFFLHCCGLQQITAYQVLAYSPSLAPLKLVLVLTVHGSWAKLLMWAQSAAVRGDPRHLMSQLIPFQCMQLANWIQGVLFKFLTCSFCFLSKKVYNQTLFFNVFPFVCMLSSAWSVQHLKFTFYIYMYSPPHRACSPSFTPRMRLSRVLLVQSPAAKNNTMHLITASEWYVTIFLFSGPGRKSQYLRAFQIWSWHDIYICCIDMMLFLFYFCFCFLWRYQWTYNNI